MLRKQAQTDGPTWTLVYQIADGLDIALRSYCTLSEGADTEEDVE